MNNLELLLDLIKEYKATHCESTLCAIADLVDNDYATLEPVMASHGVTY